MNTPTDRPTIRVPGESKAPVVKAPPDVSGTAAAAVAAAQESPALASAHPVKVTPILQGTAEEQLAAERAKVDELQRHVTDLLAASQQMLKQLQQQAANKPVEPPVKLPTMAAAKADCEARVARDEPVNRVLTVDGWYVHPWAGNQPTAADRALTNLAKMVEAQASASLAEAASRPRKADHGMEPGKAPKDD